jgi:serine/threonine protein kinase
MDYIEGETLSERLSIEPLSTDEALEIAHQLLLGLGAIHRAGVLHLDVKTSNIMLCHGRASEAIILDFGLARCALGASRRRGVRPLTGSLAYMPPEQMLGRSPAFRNDVFAFGVVLFQMLTGRLPFPIVQPAATSSLVLRLTAQAPRPSQLEPRLPRWLDELVLTCLADQDRRFQSADAVLEALDAH